MKKLLSTSLILFFALGVLAQNSTAYATIDKNCNSQAATIKITNGQSASGFVIETLIAGNNCHSGARFTQKGFVIKNSSGNLVFKYQVDSNGQIYTPNGQLSKLTLGAGIYYVYVDGGHGAILQLKYNK